ncbi:triacylglycerol lipase 1 isoform X8 [Arachis hypogaea]|uniref:triacylglycerol lipase 1 isoform X8 n=1 Tax=Arachis hypogaea TaxID=3818 RepID=UPI000DED0FBB|nr:triacylglycerol lipase 1 isoform X7 [Arachis hypogaea]
MTLIQDVDKLKRKLRHEENEQSRSGCTRIEKARHWRWISWDVILTYCLRMQAGYAWFLNTPEQSLSFILTDQGFDVWVENVHETRWSHGHRSYSVKNKKFLNWSWQELALYDMAEMINYIYSVTNSKLFIVGYSQMTTGFIQMVLTMGIHQLNFKSE